MRSGDLPFPPCHATTHLFRAEDGGHEGRGQLRVALRSFRRIQSRGEDFGGLAAEGLALLAADVRRQPQQIVGGDRACSGFRSVVVRLEKNRVRREGRRQGEKKGAGGGR